MATQQLSGIPGVLGGFNLDDALDPANVSASQQSPAPSYNDLYPLGNATTTDAAVLGNLSKESPTDRDARMNKIDSAMAGVGKYIMSANPMAAGLTTGANVLKGATGVTDGSLASGLGAVAAGYGPIGTTLGEYAAGHLMNKLGDTQDPRKVPVIDLAPQQVTTDNPQAGLNTGTWQGENRGWSESNGWGTAGSPNFSDRGPGGSSGTTGTANGYADGGMVNDALPGLNPSYATGGYIDPRMGGGAPGQMAAQGPGLMPQGNVQAPAPDATGTQVQNLLQANPQMAQGLQAVVQRAIASGKVNEQQIMQLAQIAQACLQNPDLYPKLVALAVQRGIVPPGRLPPQFDSRIVGALAMVGHGLQFMAQQTSMPPGGQQQAQYATGGMIVGPGTGTSDSIQTQNRDTGTPVSVSNGEYIIPDVVVKAKGRDFFDKMVRQYLPLTGGTGGNAKPGA